MHSTFWNNPHSLNNNNDNIIECFFNGFCGVWLHRDIRSVDRLIQSRLNFSRGWPTLLGVTQTV